MSAGIRFMEGFEGDEDSLVWESMGLVRDEDHARSGDFGIGWDGLGLVRSQSPLFPPTTSIIVGFAFRYRDSIPGGSVRIFELRGPADLTHVALHIDAQSLLSIVTLNGSSEQVPRAYSTPRRLDKGAWYYIEIGAELHASAGRVVVQLNGAAGAFGEADGEIMDVSGIPTVAPGTPDAALFYNQFHVGVLSGFLNEDRNFSFDDFYVREASEGFLGDQRVIAIDLEDDRSVDFTRLSGPKNYLMVNEVAVDDDGSYNVSDEDGAEDVFEIADQVLGGTIHAVQLVARARKTQTQVWKLQTLLDLDGTKSYGGDDGNEWYLGFPDYETLLPDVYGDAPGETGWTVEQLNAVGVGYRIEDV